MYRRIPKFLLLLSVSSLAFIGFSTWRKTSEAQTNSNRKPPNIVILLADDMGYSDVGAYGGEISTPNIDAMAKGGTKFTNFYASPACSPSRAMMLTGVDNHQIGLGTMGEDLPDSPNQQGKPGYEGYLNNRVVTLPTLLKDAGYNTYMVGKWHLGKKPELLPVSRGFTQSFVLLDGGATHFSQMGYSPGTPIANYNNNGKAATLPQSFYSTDFYTNKLIEFINNDRSSGKPFFIYAAYTAPHDPLQAPQAYMRKYMGKYDSGWDQVRAQRLQRLKQLGMVPQNVQMIPRADGVPAWNSLTPEQRRYNSKLMTTYAAMIDNLDSNIGRLVNHLKQIGEYDNTIFIFMADNGAAAHDFSKGHKEFAEWFKKEGIDNSYENIGTAKSFVAYGPGWAQVSATPHKGFKGRVYEGGIRVPFMVYYPGAVKAGATTKAFGNVRDITPTLLDFAGVEQPGSTYNDRPIIPIQGRSLRPVLEGKADRVYGENDPVGFELFGDGNRALFMGDWKVINVNKPLGDNKWRLYNIMQDPTESNDLSRQNPEQFQKMISLYEQYEKDKGVTYFSPDPNATFERGL